MKSCIGVERVWLFVGYTRYLSHNQLSMSSGIAVWKVPKFSCIWVRGGVFVLL